MVKNEWIGAGEMAQWESTCYIGVETWSKIPNTHTRAVHGSAIMGWKWMIPGICWSVHVLPN